MLHALVERHENITPNRFPVPEEILFLLHIVTNNGPKQSVPVQVNGDSSLESLRYGKLPIIGAFD